VEFAQTKLNNAKKVNYFNSLKTDLNKILKENRLLIYSFCALELGEQHNNGKILLSINAPIKTTANSLTLKRTIDPKISANAIFAYFRMFNYFITKYCDVMNTLETKEIHRLIKKADEAMEVV